MSHGLQLARNALVSEVWKTSSVAVQQRKTFQLTPPIIAMHRVARSFSTAAAVRCPKMTSAARLAAHSLRSAVVKPPAATAGHSRRMIHVRVPLPYKIEDGMADFLTPAALKVVAVDYQQGLLDRLNEQIKGASCPTAFLSGF